MSLGLVELIRFIGASLSLSRFVGTQITRITRNFFVIIFVVRGRKRVGFASREECGQNVARNFIE